MFYILDVLGLYLLDVLGLYLLDVGLHLLDVLGLYVLGLRCDDARYICDNRKFKRHRIYVRFMLYKINK